MAIPLKPDDVPKELICAICLSIPLDPRILSGCSHVFCKDCIHNSLSHHRSCPTCRSNCNWGQVSLLKEDSGIAHRIWSNIPVKCEHHGNSCEWTGAISDYKSHEKSCPANAMIRKLHSLENQNKRLVAENEMHKRRILNYQSLERENEKNYQSLKRENENLKFDRKELKRDKRKLQKGMQEAKEKAKQLLYDKISKMKHSEKLLKEENAKLKKLNGEGNSLCRENEKLKAEKKTLQNSLNISKEKSRKEIESLKCKNRKLESSIRTLEHQKKDYPRLQRENRKMKREKNSLLNDMKTMAGIRRSLSAHANDEDTSDEDSVIL